MICHSRQWSSESSEVGQLQTSSSASQTEESEPPPSSSLTHTSPYSLLSESSRSSSSSCISTKSSELCCCVPVGLGVLLHLQPGPHLLPFLTQLHHRVLHAVTLEHEQPRNSRPTCCLTASLFPTDSQSHSSFPSTIFQSYGLGLVLSCDYWQPDSTCSRSNRFTASGATGHQMRGATHPQTQSYSTHSL